MTGAAAATAAPLLRARDLHHGYAGLAVLRGVSFELAPGEGLAVLGPNGAGKSTLLSILSGLARPQQGSVEIEGRAFSRGEAQLRERFGLVSHESLLYEGLSARENLDFTLRLYGRKLSPALYAELLARVGLADLSDRPVRTFSRGMRQRLSLARALVHGPALLFLDEPMTGLDPAGRDLLSQALARFRAQGGALVMTTHELQSLAPMATRAAFLSRGRLVESAGADLSFAAIESAFRELFAPSAPREHPA